MISKSVLYGLVVVSGLAVGLNLGLLLGPGRPAAPPSSAGSVAPVAPPGNPDVNAQAPTWHGLWQASAALLSTVRQTDVVNNAGHSVPVPLHRPVVFVAPFCPWCFRAERLLIRAGLLSRVQLVGIDLTGGESAGPDLPGGIPARTVTDAAQARAAFRADWRLYGARRRRGRTLRSTAGLLYALPGNPLNQAVPSFPTFLIPHASHWYVEVGYNPSVSLWKTVLGA